MIRGTHFTYVSSTLLLPPPPPPTPHPRPQISIHVKKDRPYPETLNNIVWFAFVIQCTAEWMMTK